MNNPINKNCSNRSLKVTEKMLAALSESSCDSSNSSEDVIDAAYAQKFSCYDGTFGNDMKDKDEQWVRLYSLNLS